MDPTEQCNYVDDDCDGVIDNGFDLKTDPQNCGVCGRACELPHGGSTCQDSNQGPTCVITTCEAGWHDIDRTDANGCEYNCEKTGRDGAACDPNDANCGKELCDSVDNDCNGIINDGDAATGGPEGGTACLDYCNGVACKGECTAGITTCVGKDLICIPGKGPSQELCDGKDNDCDGVNDNGFNLGTDPNNCGACGVSCANALPNAVAQCTDPAGAAPPVCSILACKPGYKDLDPNKPGCEQCAKFPTTAETCNGIDDDCDGSHRQPEARGGPVLQQRSHQRRHALRHHHRVMRGRERLGLQLPDRRRRRSRSRHQEGARGRGELRWARRQL
jgi:Putative metal-binding motif